MHKVKGNPTKTEIMVFGHPSVLAKLDIQSMSSVWD
jgi:hypothetical protein